MKAGIHPSTHDIMLILTDGSEVVVSSTYGKPGERILLDNDPLKHVAWNKGKEAFINDKVGSVAKYKAKFAGLSFGKKAEDAA